MSRRLKLVLVGLLVFNGSVLSGAALAAVDCATQSGCTNGQDGDNGSSTDQDSEAASGDAVVGQVNGAVTSGRTSVDATNHSSDVRVSTGDADTSNDAAHFTGQQDGGGTTTVSVADVTTDFSRNAQDGDNDTDVVQAAVANSGDGVAGQVIGVVTSAGGSADVVAANTSEDVDIETGDTESANDLAAFAGQKGLGEDLVITADVFLATGNNAQDGDNTVSSSQSSTSTSGDGVGGQVIGLVAAGDTSVDATNSSDDVDIDTGETSASNDASAFAGQEDDTTEVTASDVTVGSAINAQDGDNESESAQVAEASSGDGVGGQVIGAVTSAGGSADIVAANTSEDADIETGDADVANDLATFVGQGSDPITVTADVIGGIVDDHAQDGDNDLTTDQSATASSGDGVGGQVIGVVSAGDTSLDATNRSTDVDVSTGDAEAVNDLASFVGQAVGVDASAADVTVDEAANAQDGDNEADLGQSSNASTGDAVGGQVAGVVTSAGGSTDAVISNSSEDIGIDTGDADAVNDLTSLVGQTTGDLTIAADVVVLGPVDNAQDGDNGLTAHQSATASSGDGVGGQVLGVVSAGDSSVDDTNSSEDIDLSTGDGDASNDFAAYIGQAEDDTDISTTDVEVESADNVQDGDNEKDASQDADASTGDAVGGQVSGVVTSAGGSADLVFANTAEDASAETGDSTSNNDDEEFVGQIANSIDI